MTLTDADLLRLMNGYGPPTDPQNRQHYFRVLAGRMETELGKDALLAAMLLPGKAPVWFFDGMQTR
jgi:hypothetical protein